MLCAGLAHKGLHVDKARRNHVARAVDSARAFRRIALSHGFAHLCDYAVSRHNAAARFASRSGIDQASVEEQ
jgi:hypothetical protein